MRKIMLTWIELVCLTLCWNVYGQNSTQTVNEDILPAMAPQKTEVIEQVSEKESWKKLGRNVYQYKDEWIIGDKRFKIKDFDRLIISPNNEYFCIGNSLGQGVPDTTVTLIDKNGNIIWERQNAGRICGIDISDFGYVALYSGEFLSQVGDIYLIDKNNRSIKIVTKGENIDDYEVTKIAVHNSHFTKNSNILFFVLILEKLSDDRKLSLDRKRVLVGVDETGKIIFNQPCNSIYSRKHISEWNAATYFNKWQKRILINSNCIREKSPMLTYWTVGKNELIFEKEPYPIEGISDAIFTKDGDILLLTQDKNNRYIRKLNNKGTDKAKKKIEKLLNSEEIYSFGLNNKGIIKINDREIINEIDIK